MITFSVDEDSPLHPKDEAKLLQVENKQNITYSIKSEFNDIAILDTPIGRILQFDNTYQGGIIKYDNFEGGIPYTRYYHLANILNDDIKNILILGLGSGSVISDCMQIYRFDRIDAVDIDSEVIDIAYKYFDLKEDERIHLYCNDAKEFIINTQKTYDLIIIDVFLATGMPYHFLTKQFIEQLFDILTENGVVGVNLFGTESISGNLSNIFRSEYKTYLSIFPSVYCFPVLYGAYEFYRFSCNLRYKLGQLTNIVLLASKNKTYVNKNDFIQKAKYLQKNTSLNYLKNFYLYARDYYAHNIEIEDVDIFSI